MNRIILIPAALVLLTTSEPLLAAKNSRAANNHAAFLFNETLEGFRGVDTEIMLVKKQGPEKDGCVSIKADFPGKSALEKDISLKGCLCEKLVADVYVPVDAPLDLQAGAYFKDKDGMWFQAITGFPLVRRGWQRVEFNVSPGSPDMTPEGHEAVWNKYYSDRVTGFGLMFFSSAQWTGKLMLDDVKFIPFKNPEQTLRILGFEELTENPEAYSVYEISFELPPVYSNPFDPEDIQVDALFSSPSGRTFKLPAFYHQPYRRFINENGVENIVPSGRASFRVRYTPLEPGRHTWKLFVDSGEETLKTSAHAFEVKAAAPHGFVRVSKKDSRYFETADNEFFYAVGHNIHSPFDTRCCWVMNMDIPPDRGTYAYDDYFEKMSANGENSVIVWMSNWWLSLEWTDAWPGFRGLGDYNLGNAWRLDYLLDAAARHGIYVLIVLDDHSKFSLYYDSQWDTNPYSRALGGPCEEPEDFFRLEQAFEIYKKRLRYIVARWASHPNLFGFELVAEINLTGSMKGIDGAIPAHAEWVRKVRNYLDSIDPYHRPISVQYSHDYKSLDKNVAGLPELDFILNGAYKQAGSIVPLMVETSDAACGYGKPSFSAEFGGGWIGNTPERLHADLHAGLWSNFMTCTAGTPFYWWFCHMDRFDLYYEYGSLGRFMRGEDRRCLELETKEIKVEKNDRLCKDLAALTFTNDRQGYFYVYNREASEILQGDEYKVLQSGASIDLNGMKAGNYSVEYWDTFKGKVIGISSLTSSDGTLTVDLPAFRIDIAGKIKQLD